MMKLINDFFDRYLHDEESVILLILLTIGLVVLLLLGSALAPFIVAVIIAYLMQGLVNQLLKWGVSVRLPFIAVYTLFVSIFVLMFVILLPLVWNSCGDC